MAKQTTSLRVLRGILCGTGAAVIGVYAGFCVYYHGHYFPHTTIGGISCGNQTADDLEAKNIASAQNYQLHITDRKGTNTHFPEVTFPILTNVPVKNNRL